MLKCQELRYAGSCLNKSDALEPVFVLCARDSSAPATIRLWAAMSVLDQPAERIVEALEVADAMECWHAEYNMHAAIDEVPAGQRHEGVPGSRE